MLNQRLQQCDFIQKITKFIINYNNRRSGTGYSQQSLTICRCEEIVPTVEELLRQLDAAGYSANERFAIRLSLEEALLNAIKHGHQGDPRKEVQLRYQLTSERFCAEIEDQGAGFNLQDVPDPFAPENLERPCGRGLLLMRNFMTWVRFNDSGNRVTLCLQRHSTLPQKAASAPNLAPPKR